MLLYSALQVYERSSPVHRCGEAAPAPRLELVQPSLQALETHLMVYTTTLSSALTMSCKAMLGPCYEPSFMNLR